MIPKKITLVARYTGGRCIDCGDTVCYGQRFYYYGVSRYAHVECPPRRNSMKKFQVCIIPKGRSESTYHGRYEAESHEAAAELYINQHRDSSTGALVAQTAGGIVIVVRTARIRACSALPCVSTSGPYSVSGPAR